MRQMHVAVHRAPLRIHAGRQFPASSRHIANRVQGNRLHHHIGAHESQNAHVNLWGLRVLLDQEGLRVVLG